MKVREAVGPFRAVSKHVRYELEKTDIVLRSMESAIHVKVPVRIVMGVVVPNAIGVDD